ncbi:MAG: T9SS type A sorting domain-containing protein [Candidatus Hydrothermae bacterium]|nr:T9SS type A sorting domain-containing protein [Candidatus Hydrothermae bacterium]
MDNVELRGSWQATNDVGISAILQPAGFIPDSSVGAVPVVLELENHDPSQTLTPSVTLTVYDSAGGGPYYSQTLSATLPPNSVQQLTFPDITGLPLDQGYVFHAAVFQSGDPYALNDTLSSGFSLNPPPAGAILDAFTVTLTAAGELLQGVDVDPSSGLLHVLTYQPGSGVQNTHRLYRVDPTTHTTTLLFTVPSLYPSGAASGVYEYMVDVARHHATGLFWITEYADSAGHLVGAWVMVVDSQGTLVDTFNYATRVDPFAAPAGVDADPQVQRMYLMSLPSPGYGAPMILRVDDTLGLERGYPVYNDLTYNALAVIPASRRFVLGNDLEVLLQDVLFDSLSWGDSVFHAVPLSKIKDTGIRGVDVPNETSSTATAKVWAVYGDTLHTIRLLSLGRRYNQVPVEEAPVRPRTGGLRVQVQSFHEGMLALRWSLPAGTPYRVELLDALGRRRWIHKGHAVGSRERWNVGRLHNGVYFLRLSSPKGNLTRRVVYVP